MLLLATAILGFASWPAASVDSSASLDDMVSAAAASEGVGACWCLAGDDGGSTVGLGVFMEFPPKAEGTAELWSGLMRGLKSAQKMSGQYNVD